MRQQRFRQCGCVFGAHENFVAVFAGVASAGDEVLIDLSSKECLQSFGGCFALRQYFPNLSTGIRALHGNDAEGVGPIATLGDADIVLPFSHFGLHPGQIFFSRTGVDHDAETRFSQEVNDQVINHAAGVIEHSGVERLAGNLQFGHIIGDEAGKESSAIGADHIDRAHV